MCINIDKKTPGIDSAGTAANLGSPAALAPGLRITIPRISVPKVRDKPERSRTFGTQTGYNISYYPGAKAAGLPRFAAVPAEPMPYE